MGGCRCTFQKCDNSTSNNPGMHFFHYPYKQVERVQKWINNSSNLDYIDMPSNKLRNKVVCEDHFKSSCFMNYKKESLVKTAVPTLVKLDSGEIIDLESSTIEIEILEEDKSDYSDFSPTKPIILNNRKREIGQKNIDLMPDIRNKDLFLLEVKSDENQEIKKRKMEILENVQVNAPVKKVINNVNKFTNPTVLNKFIKKEESPAPITKLLNSGITLTKLKTVNKKPTAKKLIPQRIEASKEIIAPEPVPEPKVDSSEPESEEDPLESTTQIIVEKEIPTPPQASQETIDKELYVQTMSDQAKQIEELKILMKEMIVKNSEPQTIIKPIKETSPKVSKSNLNKVQLFNGIKRYLNPSMVSLLRMEMFGGNEREWKSDEKEFSVELLNLGPSVYEYMQDEWRFRLPPKKDVEKWKVDKGDDSDMDDC